MSTAPRGYAEASDASSRRSRESAFAEATSLSVVDEILAEDEVRAVDAALAEFEARALLNAEVSADSRFALSFGDVDSGSIEAPFAESLAHVVHEAGLMPGDVAEECVRGTLDALRAAHDRRWSHGGLSLDWFTLDASGVVRLFGAGASQRAAWLAVVEGLTGEAPSRCTSRDPEVLWNEVFLEGAADDLGRIATHVVDPLLQGIDGERPFWAERLLRRLDALDGTIGSIDDLDHAWTVICDSFHGDAIDASSCVAAPVDARPDDARQDVAALDTTGESRVDDGAQRSPLPLSSLHSKAAPTGVMLWLCVVGGLAALAGTIAATAIAL